MRVLGHEDSEALRALVARDPVGNVFVAALLADGSGAVPSQPGSRMIGFFESDGALASACWVGSNVVPIEVTAAHSAYYGRWLGANWRAHASIFGPADAVLGIQAELDRGGIRAHEVRAAQPLLVIEGRSAVPANPQLRRTRSSEFDRLLTAAVAMFEEEVGYSPYLGGEENYRRRVAWLIAQGHSLSHSDEQGEIIFKADLGVVTAQATQIQGVWLNPRARGQGRSPGYMAAVVDYAQSLAPVTSLYVNDFNTRARASYARVGFEQRGTFATVLF